MSLSSIVYRLSSAEPATDFRRAALIPACRVGDATLQVAVSDDAAEVGAQPNQRLGDFRANAGEHYLRTQQLDRLRRADQSIGYLGVDHRHAGDVEDGDLGTAAGAALQPA